MRLRAFIGLIAIVVPATTALPAARVLDGGPVALSKAQAWCIAPLGDLPSWDANAHPECKMAWKVLAQHGDRTLYSARYAWPSPRSGREPLRVLTEVLFEGVRGSKIVRKLYAVQDDEAHVRLDAIRVLTVGGRMVLESRLCMPGTGECARELATWTDGRIDAIDDHTIVEIREQLPKGFELKMNPDIDLVSMSGSGKAWSRKDADCCPSAQIAFTLRLDGGQLHASGVTLKR
jgi:hypothetical protein